MDRWKASLAAEQPGFGKPAAGVVAERRMEQLSGRATGAGRRMSVDVPALLGDCAALSSVHLLAAAGLNMEKTLGTQTRHGRT